MTFTLRQKLTTIPILLYWPAIFVLTHIPVPRMIFKNIQASDKTLHYLGYLILAFLLWFAIGPGKKVNWCRAAGWWALFVMVVYGAVDEWLQGFVGRDPDAMDFLANLAGSLTGLILLSIFPFWPTSLALTGAAIFVLTNLMQTNLADQLPEINTAFYLCAYALFSLLWIKYARQLFSIKAPQPKWLIGALAVPIGFLLGVELFCVIANDGFKLQNVFISLIGIAAVVFIIFLIALLTQHPNNK